MRRPLDPPHFSRDVCAVRSGPRLSARCQLVYAGFALCLVVVLSMRLAGPATAASFDLAAYREAIQTSLSDLSNSRRSAEDIAASLRAVTTVTMPDGSNMSPDLSPIVADLVAKPAKTSDAERRLSALLTQLDLAVGTNSSATRVDAANSSLQQILARSEFQPKPAHHSETFFGWLFQEIGRLLGPVSAPLRRLLTRVIAWLTPTGLFWTVISTTVGLVSLVSLLYWLIRSLRGGFGPAVERFPVSASGERTSAVNLRGEAETLAGRHSYRLAIRSLYLAALLRLDERGVLSFERSLTNREVLQEAGASGSAQLVEQLAPLVERFDRQWYGAISCTEDDYREFTRLVSWAWEVA